MAFGHGGNRPGSGRKPKSKAERALDGNARQRGRVLKHPSAPPRALLPEVDETDAPNDLETDERLIWLELAPHALANKTLTPATSRAFRMLCRNIALLDRFARSVMEAGGPNHRGLQQRVDAEMLRFCVAPIGKAIIEDEKPAAVDPVKAKYFGA